MTSFKFALALPFAVVVTAANASAQDHGTVLVVMAPKDKPPGQPQPRQSAHGADAAPRPPRDDTWDVWGEARGRVNHMAAFGLDNLGTGHGVAQFGQTRLLAGARWMMTDKVKVDVELEALSAQVGGDTTALGLTYTDRPFAVARDGSQDLARLVPRKAMLAYTGALGQVALGAQTFSWGTGILANDGSGDNAFGDSWLGNAVARLSLATKPLAKASTLPLLQNLAVFVAGDWVIRDDNATLFDGDQATTLLVGARTEHEGTSAGLLLFYRDQTDRDDLRRPTADPSYARIVGLDVYGKTRIALSDSTVLALEAELVHLRGRTTRPWSDATWTAGADVAAWAAIGRIRFDHDTLRLSAQLESGFASGDNDPRDATARAFAMHSDHNVGLVLFDHVLPLMAARSVDRVADPRLMAVAPPSGRFAITQGGVHNAIYAFPTLRWRPIAPLQLRLGYVLAAAASPVMDPYQTGLHGGYPTNAGAKVQQAGLYGHEVDAKITWDIDLPAKSVLRLGGEGGVLVPGEALAGVPALGSPWLARGLVSVHW